MLVALANNASDGVGFGWGWWGKLLGQQGV